MKRSTLGPGVEVVPLRLGGDAGQQRAAQLGVAGAGAQHAAQRHLVFLAQAQVERAVRAQPHAVAGGAEVTRHGRDHAQHVGPAVGGPVARRAGAARRQRRHQAMTGRQPRAQRVQVDMLMGAAAVAHGHGFDQAQHEALLAGIGQQPLYVIFRRGGMHHAVELDRRETGLARGAQPSSTSARQSRPVMAWKPAASSVSRLTFRR